jgi:predicted RNase H-like HicB family nuclease
MSKLRFRPLQRFTIVIESDETGGYYAFCPTLPGCYSQGETLEETKRNLREAIQYHLESLLKDGASLPAEREEFVGTIQVPLPTRHGR